MTNKTRLIVFVKNRIPGRVKTRLAATVGNDKALFIYDELMQLTLRTAHSTNFDVCIYYADFLEQPPFESMAVSLQHGADLGERMKNAFLESQSLGYKKVICIGSDLPGISVELLQSADTELSQNSVVFGPAEDGGYYLIGLAEMVACIFENKPWSTPNLLNLTLSELNEENIGFTLLPEMNDIDTYEDLIKSGWDQKKWKQ